MSKPKEFDEIIHCERIGDSLLYNHYVVGELVRCKNCKYFKTYPLGETDCAYIGEKAWAQGELNFDPEDFCSKGERKVEE